MLTAAKASIRPQPVSLLGTGVPSGTAVLVMISSVSVTLSVGLTERSSATRPTTCGTAIDVPLETP